MKLAVNIYYKQLIFFVLAVIVLIGVYFLIANRQFLSASTENINQLTSSQKLYEIPIEILPNSNVKVFDSIDSGIINPEKDYDLFKYIAYSQEGFSVGELTVVVNLPKPIANANEVKARVYAVHGVGNTKISLFNSQTLVFTALNVSPNATYTIEMELPKGYVSIPWTKNALFYLKNIPIYYWVLISFIPVIITFIILFSIYSKVSSSWQVKSKDIMESPPSGLTPAEASVLINNKITSRSIAATFVDLARRGIISIIDHENYFTFYRNNTKTNGFGQNEQLKNYEKILLDKIFLPEERKSSLEDVQMRIAKHIFSRKIAYVYLDVYNQLFKKGYFIEDPNRFQSKYKIIAYVMLFVGVVGFILSMIYTLLPYLLLIWFSVIAGASFIIKIAPQIPIKTVFGEHQTRAWHAFKNFLTTKKNYPYSYNWQNQYEQFLPYAIAFGCERDWTQRFYGHPFKNPTWLVTQKDAVLIEDIINEIVPFIDFVSSKLTQIKEPTISINA